MAKINVLFGGAFNPPTIAHMKISEEVTKRFDCKITFLPANDFYNKGVGLESFDHRLAMVKIMASKIKDSTVSDYENTLDKYLGTYYTLRHFKDYYFLIGYDQLATIDKWINYQALIEENRFIVYPRRGYNIDKIFLNEVVKANIDHFTILDDFECLDISSTAFRDTLDPELVDEDVYKYIIENKLYK